MICLFFFISITATTVPRTCGKFIDPKTASVTWEHYFNHFSLPSFQTSCTISISHGQLYIVSHYFSCSSSPCGSSSWPMLPFHICLKLSTAVMPPFTQSQGQPPLVCFLIIMSEVKVPFLSLCMTSSSLILLPWVIWSCVYLYSWLYTPCFSSSAFGALPYLSILVPSFVFWHLAHTWKINPNHLEFFLSSNLNRSLSFWSSILSHLILMSLLNSCFSLCPPRFNTLPF